ncbi:MAG: hypothetical protein HC831_01415 [Chloroflexia bacterium]|nr:hypothetical protein [Chloroflexia bacterium]
MQKNASGLICNTYLSFIDATRSWHKTEVAPNRETPTFGRLKMIDVACPHAGKSIFKAKSIEHRYYIITPPPPSTTVPDVSTDYPGAIGATWATPEGDVLNQGGATVTSRGFCWSTSSNPTISNSKITAGSGTGHFIGTISGLTTSVRYYIRAFATNSYGTAYGNQIVVTPGDNAPL